MPKALTASINAVLVGFEQYTYQGFTAGDGKAVSGGVVYKVWVSLDVDDAPQAVKCKAESFGALKGLGFGEKVTMDVTYRAKGQAFEMTLDNFEREVPARISNGRPATSVPA